MVDKSMTAQTKVSIKPVTASGKVVPFGIVRQNYIFGATYQLKAGGGSGYNGNYAALALGGTGGENYQNNIMFGYNSTLYAGQWVSTETGDMSEPTTQGVRYRIGLDSGSNIQTVLKGSARIVTVPIINTLEVSERSEVQIVGFAAFFLEGNESNGNGNENYIYGEFIQMVSPAASVYKGEDYGLLTENVACGYGLYGSQILPNN